MDSNLIYVLVTCAIAGILASSVYISKKFEIKEQEKEAMKLTLDVIEFLNNNYKIKYNKQIGLIVEYVNQAIALIDKFDVDDSLETKKELVKHEALRICKENEIKVDEGVIALVDRVTNFIMDSYK